MKTTLDITDTLFEEAKRIAARDGETLRSLVEQGLRKVLAERQAKTKPFKLKDASFGGGGLRPEVAHLSPHEIIYFSYERDPEDDRG